MSKLGALFTSALLITCSCGAQAGTCDDLGAQIRMTASEMSLITRKVAGYADGINASFAVKDFARMREISSDARVTTLAMGSVVRKAKALMELGLENGCASASDIAAGEAQMDRIQSSTDEALAMMDKFDLALTK